MKEFRSLCTIHNVKLKTAFLGPKSENSNWLISNINSILKDWFQSRVNRFPKDGRSISVDNVNDSEFLKFQKHIESLQDILSKRFKEEVPKYSPRYMGHMVSDISLPALFGHIIGVLHNPNNSSLSAAKVGSIIEDESIQELSNMIGFDGRGIGHFTSGGTVANIEGLWRARFHLDNCLSLGAYLNTKKYTNFSLCCAAHMSFSDLVVYSERYKIDFKETKNFSFVIKGPYQISSIYHECFKEAFLGPVLIVPGHKHYSWQKALSLMGLGDEALWSVQINKHGRLCLEDLKQKIDFALKNNRPILAVVSVAGTTELGSVDEIEKIQDLLDEYKEKSIHIWHHVDAAYGGIYTSMLRGSAKLSFSLKEQVLKSFAALKRVESITLDPHKLAMVPYACGAIIVRNEHCYHISQFYAPYLKESPINSGKWNSTLEGSRSATGACATWMVAKSIGLNTEGMGELLSLCLGAKKRLEKILVDSIPEIRIIPDTDTNILCFTFLDNRKSILRANQISALIYKEIFSEDEFSVSQTTLHDSLYGKYLESLYKLWNVLEISEELVLIRMVLMNPFSISKENEFDYLLEFSKYLKILYQKLNNF